MTPKVIHFVWLGKNILPPLYRQWMEQTAAIHKGWKIRVWVSLRGLEFRKYAEQCKTLSGASDIVRFEVLRDFGGVYLDTDFCVIRNLEAAIDGAALTLCNSANRRDQMATGFIAAERHNPAMAAVCEAIRDIDFSRPAFCGAQTGPGFFRRALGNIAQIDGARVLEPRAFYPISFRDRATVETELPRIAAERPKGVYAIHAWNNSWSRTDGRA